MAGYSPRGRKELDTTKPLTLSFPLRIDLRKNILVVSPIKHVSILQNPAQKSPFGGKLSDWFLVFFLLCPGNSNSPSGQMSLLQGALADL